MLITSLSAGSIRSLPNTQEDLLTAHAIQRGKKMPEKGFRFNASV